MNFSLDPPRIGLYAIPANVLGIAVWTQSATDDPEFVSPPSMGHQILHQ